jgi:hypothetical protein
VIFDGKDRTADMINNLPAETQDWKLTLIFFFLQESQAFMILIKWACSRCSLDFVPRPAEFVTSMPSLVMIEKPGNRASAALGVSFFAFFVTRTPRLRVGGVMLMEPYAESPKVAEDPGDGV